MILRYARRFVLAILGLVLLGMAIVWIYVLFNKPEILRKVTTELNSRVNAEIHIEDIHLSFFHNFPHISVRLSDVYVRDSLWQLHRHNLLDAKKIYIEINPFSFFSKSPSISKILIEDGAVYIFADSTVYSNAAILRQDHSAKKNGLAVLPGIGLRNLHLWIEKPDHKKLFEFNILRLDCEPVTEETFFQFPINLAIVVNNLSFNTDKGSFLKGKAVEGKIKVQFNPASKVLQFNQIDLQIDQHPFTCSGKFFLAEAPLPFLLNIETEKIVFKNTTSLLPHNISEVMKQYDILKPFSITCNLDGTLPESKDPLISIKIKTNNNTVVTPVGRFSEVSFSGSFTNQVSAVLPRGDENSRLLFNAFSGTWEHFSLQSTEINFSNLTHPILAFDLHSDFDLQTLNEVTGSKSVDFEKGAGKLNISYLGPLQNSDSVETQINGNLQVRNAAVYYLPRDFLLSACNGTVLFKGQDVYISNLQAVAGSSSLKMNGSAKNLLSLMGKSSEKLVLDWNIASRSLNLHDFISFLRKPADAVSKTNQKSAVIKTGAQIDHLLKDCTVRLQLKANQFTYKKFSATAVSADLLLAYDRVELQKAALSHAGGSLEINGMIQNTSAGNTITIQSQMSKVDLPKVFAAFNNFGQTAIVDKNLQGKLTATINLNGQISNTADLEPNSLTGTIDWSIQDGRLLQYEPLEKISQLAFKNRSFSDIYFAELKDHFEILGSAIKINRMEIQSTALTMFVEGLYDMKKGADMSIQIPLSNLKSNKEVNAPINKGINSKTGISLRLRAKTASDGKLNISWDPFKRALKK
jgi:hypothetical protein